MTLEDCLAAFFAADELKGEFSSVASDSTKQGKPHAGVFHMHFGGRLNLESLPQYFTERLAVPKLGISATLSRSVFPPAHGCCFFILNLGESVFCEEQMRLLVVCECCGSLAFSVSLLSPSTP